MDALKDRIRAARDAAGLTQAQLASRVYVSPLTLSRWERGANTPHATTRRQLAVALGLPEDYFEDGDDEQAAQLRAAIDPFAESFKESMVAALMSALRELRTEGVRG